MPAHSSNEYQRKYMREYRKKNLELKNDKQITRLALGLAVRRMNINAIRKI